MCLHNQLQEGTDGRRESWRGKGRMTETVYEETGKAEGKGGERKTKKGEMSRLSLSAVPIDAYVRAVCFLNRRLRDLRIKMEFPETYRSPAANFRRPLVRYSVWERLPSRNMLLADCLTSTERKSSVCSEFRSDTSDYAVAYFISPLLIDSVVYSHPVDIHKIIERSDNL
jgi:hypothetical protein